MSPLRAKSVSRKKADPVGQAVFYPSSSILPASSPIFSRFPFNRKSSSSQSTSAPGTPPPISSHRAATGKQAPAFYIGNMADLPSTPGGPGPPTHGTGAVSPLDLELQLGRTERTKDFPFPSPTGLSPEPRLAMTTHSHGAQFVPPSPHSLSDMLQSWNLATPPGAVVPRHDSTFGIPASDSIDSLSTVDTELRSPPDLPSSQGFNSRVLSTYSPESKSSRRPSTLGLTINPLSPYSTSSRLPALPSPEPVRSPIPYRQPSWSDTRRGSVVAEALRISTANQQSPSFRPPSELFLPSQQNTFSPTAPTYASQYDLTGAGALQFDLFTPGYSMEMGAPLPAPTNGLQLSFDHPGPAAGQLSHQAQSTFGNAQFRASSGSSHRSNTTETSLTTSPVHPAGPSHPAGSKIAAKHLESWALPVPFTESYIIRDELGSGGFGFVCSAVMTGRGNEYGREVAVKFIFKERLEKGSDALVDEQPMESWVLRHCDHPNIIAWLDLFEDERYFILVQELHGDPWSPDHTLHAVQPEGHTDSVRRCSLLQIPSYQSPTPLISPLTPLHMDINPFEHQQLSPEAPMTRPRMGRRASHDLFEAVESVRFTEEEAKWIFKQIVSGVAYLHGQGAYHRDLKDENIVIDRYLNVKIIDFGSAVVENQLHAPELYGSFRGTYSYAAPEVISGSWYRAGPCDVWAIGIILAILLTGEQPFPDQNMALAGRFKLKRPTSEGARDLMEKMFRPDPTRRWGIEKVEKHRWLRNVRRPRGLPQPPNPPTGQAANVRSSAFTAATASGGRSSVALPLPSLPPALDMAYTFGTYSAGPSQSGARGSLSTYAPPVSTGRHGSA